jgi:hypothetical protein
MDAHRIRWEVGISEMIAYKYFTLPDKVYVAYIAAICKWRIVEIIGENPIATIKVEMTIDD